MKVLTRGMYYVDTSVIISYIFSSEKRHVKTRELLENLSRGTRLYTSSYALVETCNSICRKIIHGELKLIEPLNKIVESYRDHRERLRLMLSLVIGFLRKRLSLEIVDDVNFYQFQRIEEMNINIPRVFKLCIELSYDLRLRIKDLIHVVYAYLLRERYGIKYLVTADVENFEKVYDQLKRYGIELIIVKDN